MKGGRKIYDFKVIKENMINSKEKDNILKALPFFEQKVDEYIYNSETNRYYINSFFPFFPGKAWDRLFRSLGGIKSGRKNPLNADIVVTGKCHCNCWHCFRSKYHNKADLDFSLIRKFVHQSFDLGTSIIGITGGEPMLRTDILDIVRCAPSGMEVHLFTTGINMDSEFIKIAENTNLTKCIISLDHFNEEMVCAHRNYSKAFRDAMNAIALLASSQIYSAVTLCLTEDLIKENAITKYFRFVGELGVDEIRIVLPIPQGNLESRNYKRFYLDAMRVIQQIRNENQGKADQPIIVLFHEYESPKYFGCNAGSYYISLNNDGYITPCVAVPLVFGNLRHHELEEIYLEMGKYFNKSGRTCYGKRLGKIIKDHNVDTSDMPLSLELSKSLASRHIVTGMQGDFYANFYN